MRKLILAVTLLTGFAFGQYTPQVITTTSNAVSGCASIDVSENKGAVGLYVGGTWTGTLTPKIAVQGQPPAASYVVPSTSSTTQATITADGVYFANVAGASTFYLCGPTSTGSALVYINSSVALSAPDGVGGGESTSFAALTSGTNTTAAPVELPWLKGF